MRCASNVALLAVFAGTGVCLADGGGLLASSEDVLRIRPGLVMAGMDDPPAAPPIQTGTEPAAGEAGKPEDLVAHAGGEDASGLAKKLSNPVADLISVPFQFNYDSGYGPKNGGKITLNIQPVIPVTLNEDWNVIIRTIVPVIYQASPANGIEDTTGLGDTTQSFFFSPKKGDIIWGVGPVFLWPTATDGLLGTRQWGFGPTAVILKQDDGWTYGCLANQIWTIADNTGQAVNSTFVQPFVAYTFKTATTLTLNTESTYNWKTHIWTVPINLMLSQVLKLGELPVSIQLGGRYYVDAVSGQPDWGLRLNFTLLFPK